VVKGWRRECSNTRSVNFFLRPHLVEKKKVVDVFMDQTRYRRLLVTGAPGCGKTTFFLAYFTRWAWRENKAGLIIQFRDQLPGEIILLRGKENPQIVVSERLGTANLRKLVYEICDELTFDFCVLDGVRRLTLIFACSMEFDKYIRNARLSCPQYVRVSSERK
jgi:hypothetical protein